MTAWTENDKKLYSQQFDYLNQLVGRKIDGIFFYLSDTDKDYSEVQNQFGKSLHTGIDIKFDDTYYSIGCRFNSIHYGLAISKGRTMDFEFIEEEKSPVSITSNIIGQTIRSVEIYWMKIPWVGAVGYYPQEFVIKSENSFFLISSIEINFGEVNTEFTDEILIIEDEEIAKQLKLGQFGTEDNGREYFKTLNELITADKKNWL